MSRTYRKSKFEHFKTESQHVDEHINDLALRAARYPNSYNRKKVRKTREEYERDLAAAEARYEADCRAVRKSYWYCWNNPESFMYSCYVRALPERYRYYVSKFRYEPCDIDWEAEREWARRDFAKRTRDGYCNETGCNTAYKTLSKETVRNAVRQLERRIVKNQDWDHLPYPDTYLGKKHIWSVW
jgi:hypothetical protein